MSTFFVAIGAFVSQMSWFRTTAAPFSVLFVQIAAHWLGKWLAHVLPAKEVGFGRYKFNLVRLYLPSHLKYILIRLNFGTRQNPGPFTIKEHVLVTLAARSGAIADLVR